MPAGVSWGEYLRFAVAALASMALGSQAVHHLYRPLDDMDKIVEEMKSARLKQITAEEEQKTAKEEQKTAKEEQKNR